MKFPMVRGLLKAAFFAQLFLIFTFTFSTSTTLALISDGANAIDLLGQYDTQLNVSYTKGGPNNGPNNFGFNGPNSMDIDTVDHRLFVSDFNNNRVIVFNLNTENVLQDRNIDFVLGQPNFESNVAAITQSGMSGPQSLLYDSVNKRLFVISAANRVTVYNLSDGITNGENAVNVLGQVNFTASAAATTQSGMNSPTGLAYDDVNEQLYVVQSVANRVTIYDLSDGITDGENAVNVLGQANFTANAAATTQGGMNSPTHAVYDKVNERLFVAQGNAHRVTVYNLSDGTTDGENAVNVLGQANFTAGAAATTQAGMNSPGGLDYDDDNERLFVSQSTANRVTVYNLSDGITDGENAVSVLGQIDFISGAAANTQAGMNFPIAVEYDNENQRVYSVQRNANRITTYDLSDGITNGENAVDLVGQYDDNLNPVYTKFGANDGPNRWGYDFSTDVKIDEVAHRLFALDTNNSRVLVYNLDANNILVDHQPDYVLGQPNFYTGTPLTTQAGLRSPWGIEIDSENQRLFVAESGNNRVVIYDLSDGIINGENAVNVLGQVDFTSSGAAVTQAGMNFPGAMVYDNENDRLFVGSFSSNRVTVYDLSDGITNGENAVNVLGQVDFTSSGAAVTQAGMTNPEGIAYDSENQRLFVVQYIGRRVTVYDLSDGITNGENAVNVLGQPNFTSNVAATTQAGLSNAEDAAYDDENQRLFVTDYGNNRVVVYDLSDGITDGENAVNVLGQPNFTSNTLSVTQNSTGRPFFLDYDQGNERLYVPNTFLLNRIMIFDVGVDLPLIIEVTPVPTPSTDTSPSYTFSSSEAGIITYGGGCSSSTTDAVAGNNTVTFDNVGPGTYSNCTITITDLVGDVSNILNVNSFTIDPIVTTGGGGGGAGGGFGQSSSSGGSGSACTTITCISSQQDEENSTGNPDEPNQPEEPAQPNQNDQTRAELLGCTRTANSSTFNDISNHWAEQYIEELYADCVIDGKNPLTFAPDQLVTRAEITKMVFNNFIANFDSVTLSPLPFTDLDTNAWYIGYIQKAYDNGLITGYMDNTFKPNQLITRAEALKIILLGAGKTIINEDNLEFQDIASSAWYYNYVSTAMKLGIIQGYTIDGQKFFRPDAPITRAEAVKLLVELQ
jgi:6-phosphogluconolactonase (cycloisomerase 2 family)